MDIIDAISNNVDVSNGIRKQDGILRCRICGDPIEKEVDFMGDKRIVNMSCSCRRKKLEKIREQDEKRKIEDYRDRCFSNSNMKKWCFDNDDKQNDKLSMAMIRYCDNFQMFLKQGKGLLLYGNVGTGKSFYAGCIANKLIDNGYRVKMTNFSSLVNQIQSTFDHKNEIIYELNRYSLLILDDLGIERDSKYMLENIYTIIDSRYRVGKPIIVTTNLTGEELKNPTDMAYARVYDRIMEMCHPVKVDGCSRRKQKLREEFQATQDILGL